MSVRVASEWSEPPRWLTALLLVVCLYLVYSPTFLSDYLIVDELGSIGRPDQPIATRMLGSFLSYGRGLFGLYNELVYRFVRYDTFRIQLVRFLNVAAAAALAVVVLRFAERRSDSRYFAFGLAMLLFCQPGVQVSMACGLQCISNLQPAIWLSVLAWWIHFSSRGAAASTWAAVARPRTVAAWLVLMLAMQSTQTFALFSLVLVAYSAIVEWPARRREIAAYLLVASAALVASWAIYRVGLGHLHAVGQTGYDLGENALAAESNLLAVVGSAVNPLRYWSAFELWSFPFPWHATSPLLWRASTLGYAVGVAWLASVGGAIATELRESPPGARGAVAWKWLAVGACLALGAVFMIADSPRAIVEHRPHVTMTFTGVVIVTWAGALAILARRYRILRRVPAMVLAGALVLLTAWGAQADVFRGLVVKRMEQLTFIRTELGERHGGDLANIIVVLPRSNRCVTEPCRAMMGRSVSFRNHLMRENVYRYALATIGESPNGKAISFVTERPLSVPPGTAIVDWNSYVAAVERPGERRLRESRWRSRSW